MVRERVNVGVTVRTYQQFHTFNKTLYNSTYANSSHQELVLLSVVFPEDLNAVRINNGHWRLLQTLFCASKLGCGLLGGQYVGALLEWNGLAVCLMGMRHGSICRALSTTIRAGSHASLLAARFMNVA